MVKKYVIWMGNFYLKYCILLITVGVREMACDLFYAGFTLVSISLPSLENLHSRTLLHDQLRFVLENQT